MNKSKSNLSNFRDLGKENKNIKEGYIYRSAVLSNLTDYDSNQLKSLKIGRIIDLRFNNEVKDKPDTKIDGIEYSHVSFVPSIYDFDRNEMMKQIKHATKEFYDDVYEKFENLYLYLYDNEAIKQTLTSLMNHERIVYHCTGGKDRTGIISYIIERIFNESKENSINNYLKTKKYRRGYKFKVFIGSLLKGIPYYGRKVLYITTTEPYIELLNLTINELEKYHSIDEFLIKNYNIKNEDLENIRTYYKK